MWDNIADRTSDDWAPLEKKARGTSCTTGYRDELARDNTLMKCRIQNGRLKSMTMIQGRKWWNTFRQAQGPMSPPPRPSRAFHWSWLSVTLGHCTLFHFLTAILLSNIVMVISSLIYQIWVTLFLEHVCLTRTEASSVLFITRKQCSIKACGRAHERLKIRS